MPVDATWRIQSNSALVTATSSFTASLGNPTQPGSMLLLFVGTVGSGSVITQTFYTSFDPPWFLEGSQSAHFYVYRRDDQPAGETSWAIPTVAVSATYYWRAEEWGGMSGIGQPDAVQAVYQSVTTANPVDTDGGTAAPSADVADFAALAVFLVQGGTGAWPAARSYGAGSTGGPSSWNEVAWLPNGTGASGATDFALAIAEAYPGVTGNVACGLTFNTTGGGVVPGNVDAWCVCYQPAAAAPPAGVLTS